MDWESYSFVKRSDLRVSLLKSLAKEPKTPTQLKDELKKSITLISRYLAQLSERKLIECITGKERMWKLYSLTTEGKDILKKVN